MLPIYFAYDQWRQLGKPPPKILSDIWDDYCAMLSKFPEERLHQRIHAGHNCWVLPEEERFVSGELIEASCIVGTADQIAQRLAALAALDLDQVMILPAFEPRFEVLERVAADVIPRLH